MLAGSSENIPLVVMIDQSATEVILVGPQALTAKGKQILDPCKKSK